MKCVKLVAIASVAVLMSGLSFASVKLIDDANPSAGQANPSAGQVNPSAGQANPSAGSTVPPVNSSAGRSGTDTDDSMDSSD